MDVFFFRNLNTDIFYECVANSCSDFRLSVDLIPAVITQQVCFQIEALCRNYECVTERETFKTSDIFFATSNIYKHFIQHKNFAFYLLRFLVICL